MSTASGSSSALSRPRNSAVNGTHHAASGIGARDPVPGTQKNRRINRNLSKKAPPCIDTQSSDGPDVFDPKSIVPTTKSGKSMARLLERSSSIESHTPTQTRAFECIDGGLRLFTTAHTMDSIPYETDLPGETQEKETTSALQPTIVAKNNRHQQPFLAFGIEAYPTCAKVNSVCYDFVSYRRYCYNGAGCPRIHPLDRRLHLPSAVQESVRVSREKLRLRDTLHANPSTQSNDHSEENFNDSTLSGSSFRGRLPRSSPFPKKSSFGNSPVHLKNCRISSPSSSQRESSPDNVKEWGKVEKTNTPWGDRSQSDTSSSNGDESESPEHWVVHTEERDWYDSPDCPSPPRAAAVPSQLLSTYTSGNTTPVTKVHSDKVKNEVKQSHPGPRANEICRNWQRNQCTLGSHCKYIHESLQCGEPERGIKPETRRIPDSFRFTLHRHMELRFGPGLEVLEFTTGFESRWIIISKLPHKISDYKIKGLLQPFGEVLDIQRPDPNTSMDPSSVKVQFSKPSEAYNAFTNLHGAHAFSGGKLEVRLAMNKKAGGSTIKDNAVQLDFEAPNKTVYMGYANEDLANKAVEKSKQMPCRGFWTIANIHVGIPAVGLVTVKFRHVPVDVQEEEMEIFGASDDMVSERPDFNIEMEDFMDGIKRFIKTVKGTPVVEFRPPPYRDGKVRVWMYFSTPADAEAAATYIHNHHRPVYDMRGFRISAKHMKSVLFTLPHYKYSGVSGQIQAFSDEIFRRGGGYSLSTRDRQSHVILRLSGEDMKILSHLKAELEKIINGDPLMEDGKVAWDDFFGRPAGAQYLQNLERNHRGIRIEQDISRRTLRLFGVMHVRARIREILLKHMAELRAQKSYTIRLEGRLSVALLKSEYQAIQAKLGAENVKLDLWSGMLKIRGDIKAYDFAMDLVSKARSTLRVNQHSVSAVKACPVCFDEVSFPVALPCGHIYCKACMLQYLHAAIEHKFFPLSCLGNEAQCPQKLPLLMIRAVLESPDMDALGHAAFTAYIHQHPEDYHYCPTPDCNQVYRSAVSSVSIQCPSCLMKICPKCHTEAHEGLTCQEHKHGDDLFEQWAEKHHVKRCPGCKVAIEKEEGCNHMMCTLCKTHICWVCMKTFPNGEGIYGHMRLEHGGFGLADPF